MSLYMFFFYISDKIIIRDIIGDYFFITELKYGFFYFGFQVQLCQVRVDESYFVKFVSSQNQIDLRVNQIDQ